MAERHCIGDRVTRERYLDDGTWMRLGDRCLPGPLRHGTVTAAALEPRSNLHPHARRLIVHAVRWDDGTEGSGYFARGLDPEGDPDAAG